MESRSMRRPQTMIGEQLQARSSSNSLVSTSTAGTQNKGSSSNLLAVPGGYNQAQASSSSTSLTSGSNPGVRSHMRHFSRVSVVRPSDDEEPLFGQGQEPPSTNTTNHSSRSQSAPKTSPTSGSISNDDLMNATLVNSQVDPLKYLTRTLANADPSEVLAFGERLRQQTQKVQEREQMGVQRNYKSLQSVASGVAALPAAVAELDRQIADLSAVTEAMRQDAQLSQVTATPGGRGSVGSEFGSFGRSGSTGGISELVSPDEGLEAEDRVMGPRQSVLVLNNAWMRDLNGLYQKVSGAQRALPPAPGRHLVLEEQGWLLLNLVTQQPVKPVLLVLLNDFFMVAAPQHGRYTYECHWPLDERLVCDTDEQSRVLRLQTGRSGSVGLLAPSSTRLRHVYSQITKLNELAAVQKQRVVVRGRARHSIDGQSTPSTPNTVTGPVKAMGHSRKISASSVNSVHDATVEERREAARVVADIDREIAHRRWQVAVNMVASHRNDPVFGQAVDARREELKGLVWDELSTSRRHSREETAELLKMLVSLGSGIEAKQQLLQSAADDIEAQARTVNFLGDVVSYISQMAAIYFQTILATVKVYNLAFTEKGDSSRIVAWAKSQVDLYAAVFNRQLFRIAPEFKAYQRCREVSRLESSQLKGLRMDMEFMLWYVWEN